MLEAKNLCKNYRPKKGVPVKALDGISLRFPERGMVFLLGKSGSGKSTMLNVLGGLDRYDSGEIIIKGVSSKEFTQSHFDSYRNTYVGFIFQEYNVLDEFTVGANIALAIELQGRRADDETINNILKEVDLEGYGQRKPNELSGGQKQRVAIARALVKNPEIIMADEPTGALDSVTGRQVLDTLKKLSGKKLVIVVSHDREFAEKYADRIIELSDGRVISDVERSMSDEQTESAPHISFSENTVTVPAAYHLTDEDRISINKYIDGLDSGLQIEISEASDCASSAFAPTDETKIPKQDKSAFRLIKSKLPMKSAFRIGASGLKFKKLRLALTIILSCIAFTLFGLADTFGSYNNIKTCTNSIIDTGVTAAAVRKTEKKGEGIGTWWNSGYKISDEDLKSASEGMGTKLTGVFTPENGIDDMYITNHINPEAVLSETDYCIYATEFSGFAEITSKTLGDTGYSMLAGSIPDGTKNEVAISDLMYETFHVAGYYSNGKTETVSTYGDMLGKTLEICGTSYTVCGIVDTGFDLDRYIGLTEKQDSVSTAQMLLQYALSNEYSMSSRYSFACLAMVGEGCVDRMLDKNIKSAGITEQWIYLYGPGEGNSTLSFDPQNITTLASVNEVDPSIITWFDGEKKSLSEKDLLITSDMLKFNECSADDVKNLNYTLNVTNTNGDSYNEEDGYKIVGIVDGEKCGLSFAFVANDSLVESSTLGIDGVYSFAVGTMPKKPDEVKSLVSYCYNEDSPIRFELQNSVCYELDTVNTILKTLSTVFFWIGVGFAAFAALMLANFIGTSISYKKQEIGILRAIGSRSSDVFRIFFSESFIIAATNFVLSCVGVLASTMAINSVIRTHYGILITVLSFGARQIGLLLVLSLLIAAAASYIPVKKIASKRPIDAIRNR